MAADRGIFRTRVLSHKPLCREHFALTLSVPEFPACIPGQFLQVLCRDPEVRLSTSGLLRRPFSVGGLRRKSSRVEIDLVGRVVGIGTAWLDGRREGDIVDILGPLGRGFSPPKRGELALLVAGGVGLPPIRWLCEILREMGHSCEFFFGAQTAQLVPVALDPPPDTKGVPILCAADTARISAPIAVTTDDGSLGMRGRVTDALNLRIASELKPESVRVYACGPEPMLQAVAMICASRGIACEVALERVMGCGMGTCQSCVVAMDRDELGRKYALCCRDGPVFDATKVAWAAR